jgi:large subunit ribosomal protein L21
MFAIVEVSGEQFKIDSTSKTLRVPYMAEAKAGQKVNLGKALVSQGNDGGITFGAAAGPTATVIGHIRGEKVIVFHKKRRKRYRKTNGHTPRFTELAISW